MFDIDLENQVLEQKCVHGRERDSASLHNDNSRPTIQSLTGLE